MRGPPVRYLWRGLPHGHDRAMCRRRMASMAAVCALGHDRRAHDRRRAAPRRRTAPSRPLGIGGRAEGPRGRRRGRDARTGPGSDRRVHRPTRGDGCDPGPRSSTRMDAGRKFTARAPRRGECGPADRRHGARRRRLGWPTSRRRAASWHRRAARSVEPRDPNLGAAAVSRSTRRGPRRPRRLPPRRRSSARGARTPRHRVRSGARRMVGTVSNLVRAPPARPRRAPKRPERHHRGRRHRRRPTPR